MAGNDPALDGSAGEPVDAVPTTRREQAVARSLDSARSRAEKRVQRFLDAAVELMATDAGGDFTVQELVARSRQSLRSFYQYFAGKHELLLALFEETVRATAVQLEEAMAVHDDPLDRLHCFTVEYYRVCRPGAKQPKRAPTPALGAFARQLLTDHPQEAAQAYVPMVALLERVLDDAAARGRVRPGLDHRRVVGVVLQAISFHAFSTTISGSSTARRAEDEQAAAEELWQLIAHGIGATPRT